jgi:hypothetical protein
MPFIGTELQEVPHFDSGISPLFPVAHANPTANPLINLRNWTVVFCNTKVIYPALDVLPEFHHPVIHGNPPASTGEFTNSSFEFIKRFIGPTNSATSKGKTEK